MRQQSPRRRPELVKLARVTRDRLDSSDSDCNALVRSSLSAAQMSGSLEGNDGGGVGGCVGGRVVGFAVGRVGGRVGDRVGDRVGWGVRAVP